MWQTSRKSRALFRPRVLFSGGETLRRGNGGIMKFNIRDITKLPNTLSLLRILLIPVFVSVLLWENGIIGSSEAEHRANGYVVAAIIVIISGLTDAADGFIARRFNMMTDLGKVLDPLADKLTQAAVIACLIVRYRSIWPLVTAMFALIFVKEIVMLIIGVAFLKKGQDLGGAKWFGKLATVVFYILVIVLIGAPGMSDTAAAVMIAVMAVFALLSFVLYMREYFRLWKKRGTDSDNG